MLIDVAAEVCFIIEPTCVLLHYWCSNIIPSQSASFASSLSDNHHDHHGTNLSPALLMLKHHSITKAPLPSPSSPSHYHYASVSPASLHRHHQCIINIALSHNHHDHYWPCCTLLFHNLFQVRKPSKWDEVRWSHDWFYPKSVNILSIK